MLYDSHFNSHFNSHFDDLFNNFDLNSCENLIPVGKANGLNGGRQIDLKNGIHFNEKLIGIND